MDQELKNRLEEIQKSLSSMEKSLRKPTRWGFVAEGLWRGVGYLIGLVIAVAIFGWLLNIVGVIPFLNNFSQDMKEILQTSVRNR